MAWLLHLAPLGQAGVEDGQGDKLAESQDTADTLVGHLQLLRNESEYWIDYDKHHGDGECWDKQTKR